MGGATAGGWPYVTPDDHPKEFPAASQTLANKLDSAVKGVRSGANIGSAASLAVTFTPPFKTGTTPVVVATNGDAATNGSVYFAVSGATATGFTVNAKDWTAGGWRVNWVAVGVDT